MIADVWSYRVYSEYTYCVRSDPNGEYSLWQISARFPFLQEIGEYFHRFERIHMRNVV